MIGRLQGILLEKQPPEILLNVQGVGYELLLPMTSFYDLPEIGQETTLFTHFVVREDAHLLFGFAQKTDRTLFRDFFVESNQIRAGPAIEPSVEKSSDEASSALIALGYKPAEAEKLVKRVAKPELTSEQVIREALKAAL